MSVKNPLPIAVLISGNGSNLQAIIDAIASGLPAKIVVVISNSENAYGLERAKQAGLPTEILSHHSSQTRDAFDTMLAEHLNSYQPELIILAGFMRILGPSFLDKFPNRILNIHPSLLPKHRGLNTHKAALDAKDTNHGVTVHLVTAELDAGPIIAQAMIPIAPGDTPDSLKEKVHTLEHRLYPIVIGLYASGRLRCENNHPLLDGLKLPENGMRFAHLHNMDCKE